MKLVEKTAVSAEDASATTAARGKKYIDAIKHRKRMEDHGGVIDKVRATMDEARKQKKWDRSRDLNAKWHDSRVSMAEKKLEEANKAFSDSKKELRNIHLRRAGKAGLVGLAGAGLTAATIYGHRALKKRKEKREMDKNSSYEAGLEWGMEKAASVGVGVSVPISFGKHPYASEFDSHHTPGYRTRKAPMGQGMRKDYRKKRRAYVRSRMAGMSEGEAIKSHGYKEIKD
jgi:hypothetical protein